MLFRTHVVLALTFLGCQVYDPSLLGGPMGETSSGNGGQGGSSTTSTDVGTAGASTTATTVTGTSTSTGAAGSMGGAGFGGQDNDAETSDVVEDRSTPSADASIDASDGSARGDAGCARCALQFDGIDDYVGAGVQDIPPDFTLEAWLYPIGTGVPEEMIVAQDRSHQAQGQFRLGLLNPADGTPGQLYFEMSDAAGSDYGLSMGSAMRHLISPALITRNQWTHVGVTKSGADFALLVNGTSVATFTTTAAFSYAGPAVEFRIGARTAPTGNGPELNFKGLVAEVRLWSVPRTAVQIASRMRQTIAASDSDWVTLQSCWRLDEGMGNATRDAKGGAIGLLVGGPIWVSNTPF